MQRNSNLVMFECGTDRPVWQSITSRLESFTSRPGNESAVLVMQDDGNAVMLLASQVIWQTRTAQLNDYPVVEARQRTGTAEDLRLRFAVSPNGMWRLDCFDDREVVLTGQTPLGFTTHWTAIIAEPTWSLKPAKYRTAAGDTMSNTGVRGVHRTTFAVHDNGSVSVSTSSFETYQTNPTKQL